MLRPKGSIGRIDEDISVIEIAYVPNKEEDKNSFSYKIKSYFGLVPSAS